MRGDLMRMVLLHGAASDAVSQGACEGVGGGPGVIVLDLPERPVQTIGDSVAHASANAAAMVYAMGQLGPFGPPTEPPRPKTPKPTVETLHTPLRDRKKELRRLVAGRARAQRLAKRLRSRKAQVFSFKSAECTMEINGHAFPVSDVKLEWANDASVRDSHFYNRTRELLHPK